MRPAQNGSHTPTGSPPGTSAMEADSQYDGQSGGRPSSSLTGSSEDSKGVDKYELLKREFAAVKKELQAAEARATRLQQANDTLRRDKDDLLRIVQRSLATSTSRDDDEPGEEDKHAASRDAKRQTQQSDRVQDLAHKNEKHTAPLASSRGVEDVSTPSADEAQRRPLFHQDTEHADRSTDPRLRPGRMAENRSPEAELQGTGERGQPNSFRPRDQGSSFHRRDDSTPYLGSHNMHDKFERKPPIKLAARGYGGLIDVCSRTRLEHHGQAAMMRFQLPETYQAHGVATLMDFARFMAEWEGCLEFTLNVRDRDWFFRPSDPAASAVLYDYIRQTVDARVTSARPLAMRDGRTLVVRGPIDGEVEKAMTACIAAAAGPSGVQIPSPTYSDHMGDTTAITKFTDPNFVVRILKYIYKARQERFNPLKGLKIYRE